MTNTEGEQKPKALAGALTRPRYETGNYLSAPDLLTEQRYRLQRLRRHNRRLHAWGVVCGLWVVPAGDPRLLWALLVCPGYAIGPHGDEIEVPVPVAVDVCDYLWSRPSPCGEPACRAYVGIRYAERQACPVPTAPPDCRCDDTIYKPSRLQDCFRVDVLWELPQAGAAEGFDMCQESQPPCPDCPESPYVVLASVILPGSEGDPITSGDIEWGDRRQIHPTDVLQHQLIACCCEQGSPLLK